MSKKKAIVCTTLFTIVMFGIYVSTFLIKSQHGFKLFDIVAPVICASWMADKMKKFYDWVIKEDSTNKI